MKLLELARSWGAGPVWDWPKFRGWLYLVESGDGAAVVAVTFHEGEPPQVHFWPRPGTGALAIVRAGRAILPQLVAVAGGTLRASIESERLARLCVLLGAHPAGKGVFEWQSHPRPSRRSPRRPRRRP